MAQSQNQSPPPQTESSEDSMLCYSSTFSSSSSEIDTLNSTPLVLARHFAKIECKRDPTIDFRTKYESLHKAYLSQTQQNNSKSKGKLIREAPKQIEVTGEEYKEILEKKSIVGLEQVNTVEELDEILKKREEILNSKKQSITKMDSGKISTKNNNDIKEEISISRKPSLKKMESGKISAQKNVDFTLESGKNSISKGKIIENIEEINKSKGNIHNMSQICENSDENNWSKIAVGEPSQKTTEISIDLNQSKIISENQEPSEEIHNLHESTTSATKKRLNKLDSVQKEKPIDILEEKQPESKPNSLKKSSKKQKISKKISEKKDEKNFFSQQSIDAALIEISTKRESSKKKSEEKSLIQPKSESPKIKISETSKNKSKKQSKNSKSTKKSEEIENENKTPLYDKQTSEEKEIKEKKNRSRAKTVKNKNEIVVERVKTRSQTNQKQKLKPSKTIQETIKDAQKNLPSQEKRNEEQNQMVEGKRKRGKKTEDKQLSQDKPTIRPSKKVKK